MSSPDKKKFVIKNTTSTTKNLNINLLPLDSPFLNHNKQSKHKVIKLKYKKSKDGDNIEHSYKKIRTMFNNSILVSKITETKKKKNKPIKKVSVFTPKKLNKYNSLSFVSPYKTKLFSSSSKNLHHSLNFNKSTNSSMSKTSLPDIQSIPGVASKKALVRSSDNLLCQKDTPPRRHSMATNTRVGLRSQSFCLPLYQIKKKKELIIPRNSIQNIEKETEKLNEQIKYEKNQPFSGSSHSKLIKQFVVGEFTKKFKEMFEDLSFPKVDENKQKEMHQLASNCTLLQKLNSNVAYSQRFFFANKIGFNWNEKYKFKKKDRAKVHNYTGGKPDDIFL